MVVRAVLRVVLVHVMPEPRQHDPVIASAPKTALGSRRGGS
jgi:hypothetical protein